MVEGAPFPKITHYDPEITNFDNYLIEGNQNWFLQEKMDGSNFGFHSDGSQIKYYNKGSEVKENPVWRKSIKGIDTIKHKLNQNYIYYGESITEKCHVTITYDTTPPFWVILYDIKEKDTGRNLHYTEVKIEADRLGLMMAQVLHDNTGLNKNIAYIVPELIYDIENGKIKSCLGGNIEGIVIKHPTFKGSDGNISYRRQKYVTSQHKEQHHMKNIKIKVDKSSPDNAFFEYGKTYATEARFMKSVQRLKEKNILNPNKNKNIKPLMDDLDSDLLSERKNDIVEYIWNFFEKTINDAIDNKEKMFGSICLNYDSKLDYEYIKEMLFIEYSNNVLKGSREGFVSWYNRI